MSEPAKGEGQRCTGSMSLCDEEDASFFHLFLGLLLELRLSVHPLHHPLPGRAEAWGLCCVEDSEDKGTSLFPPFLPPNKHESDVLRARDVCAGVCVGGRVLHLMSYTFWGESQVMYLSPEEWS